LFLSFLNILNITGTDRESLSETITEYRLIEQNYYLYCYFSVVYFNK